MTNEARKQREARGIGHWTSVIGHFPRLPENFPTRNLAGYLFVLAAMWYAGASQGNGAAYLLFFLLLGVVLVSIPQTFANLRGLKVARDPLNRCLPGRRSSSPGNPQSVALVAPHDFGGSSGHGRRLQVVDEIPAGKARGRRFIFRR